MTKKSIPLRLLARQADYADNSPELKITPLHSAAFHGQIAELKKLIAAGAPVNAPDFYGWTPLHDAVISGHTEAVELLIAASANVNAQDNEEQYTPLHEAIRMNYPAIQKILLQAGADVTLKDRWGNRCD